MLTEYNPNKPLVLVLLCRENYYIVVKYCIFCEAKHSINLKTFKKNAIILSNETSNYFFMLLTLMFCLEIHSSKNYTWHIVSGWYVAVIHFLMLWDLIIINIYFNFFVIHNEYISDTCLPLTKLYCNALGLCYFKYNNKIIIYYVNMTFYLLA